MISIGNLVGKVTATINQLCPCYSLLKKLWTVTMVRDWQDKRLYRPENIQWNSWHLQVGEYMPGIR